MPSGRRDHRNKKATAGSGRDRKTVQKKEKVSRIFIFVLIGIFAAVIGVSVTVIVGMATGPDPMIKRCENYFEILKSGNMQLLNDSDFDIHFINSCETTNFNCNFDPTTCQYPCPFGFDKDEDTRCYICSCAQEGLFQGDMHFDENEIENMMELYGQKQISKEEETFAIFFSSAIKTANRWTIKNSRVLLPYTTTQDLDSGTFEAIKKTSQVLKEKTCFDLVPRSGEQYYIAYQKRKGCSSPMGPQPGGNSVSISSGCANFYSVFHETMHSMGFHHEHCRPDRDDALDIHWDNVRPSFRGVDFKKMTESEVYQLNTKYDTGSFMQYDSLTANINMKPTMTFKGTMTPIRHDYRPVPPNTDIDELNTSYNCKKQGGSWTVQGNGMPPGASGPSPSPYGPSPSPYGPSPSPYGPSPSPYRPSPSPYKPSPSPYGPSPSPYGPSPSPYGPSPSPYGPSPSPYGPSPSPYRPSPSPYKPSPSPYGPSPSPYGPSPSPYGPSPSPYRPSPSPYGPSPSPYGPSPSPYKPSPSPYGPSPSPYGPSPSPYRPSPSPYGPSPSPYGPSPSPYKPSPSPYGPSPSPYRPSPSPYRPSPSPYRPSPSPYGPSPSPYRPSPSPYRPSTYSPYRPSPSPYRPSPYRPSPSPYRPSPSPYRPSPSPYRPSPSPYRPSPSPYTPSPSPYRPSPSPYRPSPSPYSPYPKPYRPSPTSPYRPSPSPYRPSPSSYRPSPSPYRPSPSPYRPSSSPYRPSSSPYSPYPRPYGGSSSYRPFGRSTSYPNRPGSTASYRSHYGRSSSFSFSPSPTSLFTPFPTTYGRSSSGILLRDAASVNLTESTDSLQQSDNWSEWSQWNSCSMTCKERAEKNVFRKRFRSCFGADDSLGSNCPDSNLERQECLIPFCSAPNGEWSQWNSWSDCSVTCGGGKRDRGRECPESTNCSKAYAGHWEYVNCATQKCGEELDPPRWLSWSPWLGCDGSCRKPGTQKRIRECKHGDELSDDCLDGEYDRDGVGFETQSCLAGCAGKIAIPDVDPVVSNVFRDPIYVIFLCPYGYIIAGKFNSDKFEDLICLHPDGYIHLYFSTGSEDMSAKVRWQGATALCPFMFDVPNTQYFVGDVNNDDLDDLLCYNSETQEIEIALNKGGKFDPVIDWSGKRDRCNQVRYLEDVDGDGRDDLICGEGNVHFKYFYHNG